MEMTCPHCGVDGSADDSLLGRKVKCPKCNGIFGITAEMVQPILISDNDIEELFDENELPEIDETDDDHFSDEDTEDVLTSLASEDEDEDEDGPELADLLEDEFVEDVYDEGTVVESFDDGEVEELLGVEGDDSDFEEVELEAEDVDTESFAEDLLLDDEQDFELMEEVAEDIEAVDSEELGDVDERSEYEKQEDASYIPSSVLESSGEESEAGAFEFGSDEVEEIPVEKDTVELQEESVELTEVEVVTVEEESVEAEEDSENLSDNEVEEDSADQDTAEVEEESVKLRGKELQEETAEEDGVETAEESIEPSSDAIGEKKKTVKSSGFGSFLKRLFS
jgi:hypothetical protein